MALATLALFDVVAGSVMSWNRQRLSPNIKMISNAYDYGFEPNQNVHAAIWGHRLYRLHTNSLGFRDRASREIPLETDRHRLLFIGDSFTLGIGCDYADTFAGRVDTALRPRGIDVLNAAVDGYCTYHYYRKVRHYIETVGLQLDRVVCCIDLSDIAEDVWRHRAAGTSPPHGGQRASAGRALPELSFRRNWRTTLRSRSLLVDVAYRIRLALSPDRPLDEGIAKWTSDVDAFEQYGREGLALAMANMQQLHEILEQHGVAMTVVVYPWPDQVVRHELETRQVTAWREWTQARGIDFIDCFPAFMGEFQDPMDAVDAWFIRGDAHFNEAGHAVVARAILDHFAERGKEWSLESTKDANGGGA